MPLLATNVWREKERVVVQFLEVFSMDPSIRIRSPKTPCAIGSSLPLSNQGPGIPLPALVPHVLLNRLPDALYHLPIPPSARLARPRTPFINLRAQHPPPPPLNRLW